MADSVVCLPGNISTRLPAIKVTISSGLHLDGGCGLFDAEVTGGCPLRLRQANASRGISLVHLVGSVSNGVSTGTLSI
jgi:hypothetical protein